MHVIGTVGLAGSGKGEFADVAREAGLPVVTMGDVVREECRRRGLDPETHHGDVARRLREEDGEAAIAERSLPMVEDALDEDGVEAVLIDGLRAPVEADRIEAAFGDAFLLVSIEAPFETRARRLRGRARDRSDADDRRLRDRDERELGFGMGEVMDRADVVLDNTGSIESFRRRVRAILADPEAARRGDLDLSLDGGDDTESAGDDAATPEDDATTPEDDPESAGNDGPVDAVATPDGAGGSDGGGEGAGGDGGGDRR